MLFSVVMFVSCNRQQSIQEYYVEKQETDNFIAIDLPASIIKLGEEVSPETRETMSTIRKLNILALKVDDTNREQFDKEYATVREILTGDKYNELLRVRHENIQVQIKYQGDEDTVDEFIMFAADKEKGFALARVLGDHMRPERIMKMTQDLKNMDANEDALAQIGELLGEFGNN